MTANDKIIELPDEITKGAIEKLNEPLRKKFDEIMKILRENKELIEPVFMMTGKYLARQKGEPSTTVQMLMERYKKIHEKYEDKDD